MQLGARWQAGEAPHRGVPPELHAAVTAQEVAHPDASAWTLTWLEGRPRLTLDDLIRITIDAEGTIISEAIASVNSPIVGDDDDDDDWLN